MTSIASARLPAGFQLRDAPREGDRPWVRDVSRRTGYFAPSEVEIAGELVDAWVERGESSGYRFLFAESEGERFGYVCFGPIPCTTWSHDLYWIAVDPACQGRGLGVALVAEVERRVLEAGGTRVYIDTSGRAQYEPTRAFYLRCGYGEAARLPEFYGPGDDKVVFGKVLR